MSKLHGKILLVGGGSGGHMTPLVAVAEMLQRKTAEIEIIAVCERKSRFLSIFNEAASITKVKTIYAGKLRRYPNRSWWQRLTDVKTIYFNTRDFLLTIIGFFESLALLMRYRPGLVFVKGGFVGVPVGLAAVFLRIPIITHDSDFLPGLTNKILSRWAVLHLEGMPVEKETESSVYVGIPLSKVYTKIADEQKNKYKKELDIPKDAVVLTVIGGSLGGEQLNNDVLDIAAELLAKVPKLHITHITGQKHEKAVKDAYASILPPKVLHKVIAVGFTSEAYKYTGAADVVIARAGANTTSELAVQGKAIILVPGRLSGDHQRYNATYFSQRKAAEMVEWGDKESLLKITLKLFQDDASRHLLEEKLSSFAVVNSAERIAAILIEQLDGRLLSSDNSESNL